MDKDTATTILGGVMAVAQAATPVMNGIQGSMHQGDFISLFLAATMALFGFFTNKTK